MFSSYKETSAEVTWFVQKKRRLRGDFIAVYTLLKRGRGGGGTDFALVNSDRTQGNSRMPGQGKLR